MDIADIRQKNLLSLLEQYKTQGITQAKFAELVGTKPAYISQLKAGYKKTGERIAMGDDVARGIETAFNLPYGVMDRQNTITNINNGGIFVVGDNHGTQTQTNHHYNTKNNNDWFIVTDHALSPTFCKNDHVLIDRARKPQAGDYVLAEYDGKQIFRKYRPPRFDDNGTEYEQLVVYNDDYPILDSRFHTFVVLGVAVEHKRRLV